MIFYLNHIFRERLGSDGAFYKLITYNKKFSEFCDKLENYEKIKVIQYSLHISKNIFNILGSKQKYTLIGYINTILKFTSFLSRLCRIS